MILTERDFSPNSIPDGPSQYYTGRASGGAYFTWQKTGGQKTAIYNRRFFAPFIREEDAVLDYGCGGGYLLQALSCRTKTGVDINPAARAEAQALGIEVFSDPAELGDRKFDVIISSHCLEHVASPYEALARLRKLLDKNGKIVLLLPVDDWRNEPWPGPDINFHLYTWTPKLLGNLLVAAGFEPIFIRMVNYVNPPRIDQYLWDLSQCLFGVLGYVFSVVLRRRQIWALGRATDFRSTAMGEIG
jgi:SAM-dependent methyltransferase